MLTVAQLCKEAHMNKRFNSRIVKTCFLAGAMAAIAWPAIAADTSSPAVLARPDRMVSARTAIKAKDWKKALEELNLAVKEQPKNADVHNLLGYSNRKQAQPNLPKAFEHYKMALQLDPNHKGAHEYIGEAYLMDKQPEEAEKHLAMLEKLCGNKTCEEYADLAKAIAEYRVKSN
jgi:Flp pilus assembly protein TadD